MRKLLDAVLAAPDDDAPRLVYADWLLERGDPRGEFIQLQCQIAAAKDRYAPEIEALKKRAKKLQKAHQRTWAAALREHVYAYTWRRGFVEAVTGKAAKLLPALPKIFAAMPVDTVAVTGMKKKEEYALFAQTKALLGVKRLDVFQNRIGPAEATLFHSPHLANVVELQASRNPLGTEGAAVLAAAPHLKALRTLTLWKCGLGIESVVALSRASFFPRLRKLDLSNNSQMWGDDLVGAELGEAFVRARELRELDLGWCQVDDEAVVALANCTGLKKLEKLSLSRYGARELSLATVKAIVESPHLRKLKDLDGVCPYQRRQLAKGKKGSGAKFEVAKMLNDRYGAPSDDDDGSNW